MCHCRILQCDCAAIHLLCKSSKICYIEIMENQNSPNVAKMKNFFAKPAAWILLILAAILLVVLGSSFYIVDETEQAVVTRFGKYLKTSDPGLQFKLPFGIDKNFNVPVKVVQTEQFGFTTIKAGRSNEYRNNVTSESSMLTGDLNIVDVEWTIQYRIVEPRKWLFGVYEKKQTIRDISRSVINELVGDRAILNVMGSDRAEIELKALEMMNENFSTLGLGISVIAVKLQNIVPPQDVQVAFEDVNKAIQDMNRFINEGKEAYNSQIPKAQGEADKQIQMAEGYAAERVNMAQGDVARFNAVYEEYRRSPRVTRERIYLETMEEIFGSETKPELIDSELENILPVKNLNGARANPKP